MLVVPPLIGHLPNGRQAVGGGGLTPEIAIEIAGRACGHQALGPLGSPLSGPLFASHARSITCAGSGAAQRSGKLSAFSQIAPWASSHATRSLLRALAPAARAEDTVARTSTPGCERLLANAGAES
jgi:hypothetical protein